MPMDERAAIYMAGPPEAVVRDAYDYGPTRYSLDVTNDMPNGHVLVGKSLSGRVIFREQLIGGVLRPWQPAILNEGPYVNKLSLGVLS
jgi:hypothetical protein